MPKSGNGFLDAAKPRPLDTAKPRPLDTAKPRPLDTAKPRPLDMAAPSLISQKEEEKAGSQMREDKTRERYGKNKGGGEGGGTLNQMKAQARKLKEEGGLDKIMKGKGGGGAKGPKQGTAHLLKIAWLNLIDSFGLTLIYINLHVFGRSVFGEKIFCELGEEWVPPHLRASLGSDEVKGQMRKFALIEKTVLIFLDLLVLFCLLFIIALIVMIVDFMSEGWWGKTKTILKFGWTGIRALVKLFF